MALDLLIALPPPEEQEAIVSYLNSSTQKLDELMCEASEAIDLLQERHSAPISAALTGKINVWSVTIGSGEGQTSFEWQRVNA